MGKAATPGSPIRHRLLEGVLLRLARLPDAGGLALRGGMLLRHWFHPLPRPAADLDLIAPSPLTVEVASDRYLPMFADESIRDGVAFDAERIRMEGIWQHTANPGVRIHARGSFDQADADIQVDLTGGPLPHPAAVFRELRTMSGVSAHIWMCRPESVVGQKVQALVHLGMTGWRPKDLDDLRLLLERIPMDENILRHAIRTSMTEMGRTLIDARAIFEPLSWWGMKLSSARWMDYIMAVRGRDVPRDLAAVAAGVANRLTRVLEESP